MRRQSAAATALFARARSPRRHIIFPTAEKRRRAALATALHIRSLCGKSSLRTRWDNLVEFITRQSRMISGVICKLFLLFSRGCPLPLSTAAFLGDLCGLCARHPAVFRFDETRWVTATKRCGGGCPSRNGPKAARAPVKSSGGRGLTRAPCAWDTRLHTTTGRLRHLSSVDFQG